MKFAVLVAMLATTEAAVVTSGCAERAGAETNVNACTCHTDCTLCGYSATPTAATDCVTCADSGKEVVLSGGALTGACTDIVVGAGAGAGAAATAGKAAIGALCDSDAEDSGCADGGRCSGVAGAEVCILSELCIDPIPCGALKLGASLAAALAMASYL